MPPFWYWLGYSKFSWVCDKGQFEEYVPFWMVAFQGLSSNSRVYSFGQMLFWRNLSSTTPIHPNSCSVLAFLICKTHIWDFHARSPQEVCLEMSTVSGWWLMTEHLYQFEVGDPWEGLVLSRLGWLMITHLSVEKTNRTKHVNISPWIFTCYIYIYIIVICMQLSLYICTYLCIPALCNRR